MKKVIFTIVAILILFVVLGMTKTGIFASDNRSVLPEIPTEQEQIKEDIANKKYNRLLSEWAYDSRFVDDVYAEFPSFYGGAYINCDKDLVIQVTSINDEITSYFKNIIDLEDVIFEEVKYPYDRLVKDHDLIADRILCNIEDNYNQRVSGIGISIPENKITVYLEISQNDFESEPNYSLLVNEVIKDTEEIKYVFDTEKCVPATTIQPGTYIANRSVGFWANDSSGNIGIVTAPHNTISSGSTIYINGTTFGTAGTAYYSGSVDGVFIKRTNSSFTESRVVSGWGFSLVSSGYTTLAVGSTTYSKGVTSGAQTGQVVDINYTTTYGITNCVVSSATCASGDSGGIVAGGGSYSSRYVAGIVTGTRGGDSYQIYIKANNLLSTLGVSVY